MSIKKYIDDIHSAEFELFEKKLGLAIERAYLQGVEDGQSKNAYPEVLKKEHLCKIFQAEMPTITKLVARKDFPKFNPIQARYPRDQVFKWIERNSSDFGKNLLQFKTVN